MNPGEDGDEYFNEDVDEDGDEYFNEDDDDDAFRILYGRVDHDEDDDAFRILYGRVDHDEDDVIDTRVDTFFSVRNGFERKLNQLFKTIPNQLFETLPEKNKENVKTHVSHMLTKLKKDYPTIPESVWFALLQKYKPYDAKKDVLFFKKILKDPYFKLFSISPSFNHVMKANEFTGAIDFMVTELLQKLTHEQISEYNASLQYTAHQLRIICQPAGEAETKDFIAMITYYIMGYPPEIFKAVTPRTCALRTDALIIHDQKNIGNCTFMVMTSFTIKIIEVLYICNTNGRLLGNIQIINIDFLSDIFTVTNFLIMQSLKTHDKQTKYLYMIAKQNYTNETETGYSFNDFYTYIYIYVYLFMYILTILDDYSKDISSCSEMKCRLNYIESCTSESVVDRGTSFKEELQFYEKLKTEVFTTQPSDLIARRIAHKEQCIKEKTIELGNIDEALRVCNDAALLTIPREVLTRLLNPLFRCIFQNYTFEYYGYRYVRATGKSTWTIFKPPHRNPPKAVYLKIQNNTFSPISTIDPSVFPTDRVHFPTDLNGCILMYNYLMLKCNTNIYKLLPISIGIELGQIEHHLYNEPNVSTRGANMAAFLVAISNIPLFITDPGGWMASWEQLVKIGDIHASHSMVIIFNSVTGIAVTRNNWKNCATHLPLNSELFGWLVFNGFIPEFSFFESHCRSYQIIGGKKKIKRSNKKNIKRSNKRNIKRSNRCIKKSNKKTNKRK